MLFKEQLTEYSDPSFMNRAYFPDPGDRDVYNGIQEINKNNYFESLEHFEKGSNYDNEYALLFSAIIYLTGFGLEKREPRKSMELCKKIASDWKNPVAQYLIGCMYFDGVKGVPEDKKSGVHWISLAAESGWPYAIAKMGQIYAFGAYVEKDHKQAINMYDKLTKNDESENKLIKDETFYLFGNEKFEVDFTNVNQEEIKKVQDCLNQGSISPVKIISITNKYKVSHYDDYFHRIFLWNLLTRKKSSGVVASQIGLYNIYTTGGSNVPWNTDKALYWAKMAGKNGHERLCVNAGQMYLCNSDYTEAMIWFKKSTALGGTFGLFFIGLMYYKALGVKRSCEIAIECFNDFTNEEDDDADAYYLMAEIYQVGGERLRQSSEIACEFYKKAFQLGKPMGATRIAAIHCKGLGVKKDNTEAFEWLKKASWNGCSIASSLMSLIAVVGFRAAEPFIIAVLNITTSELELFNSYVVHK
ncbi:hypothetical protein BD770DRAFT_430773 [Pilaira anomala]|nr:hypothetical protein BD770DRAFT_430773 [Pilaira anomala]